MGFLWAALCPTAAGHRISGRRSKANWRIPQPVGVPFPGMVFAGAHTAHTEFMTECMCCESVVVQVLSHLCCYCATWQKPSCRCPSCPPWLRARGALAHSTWWTFGCGGGGGAQQTRVNVNLLKLIQLGITFFDAEGKTPHPISTWQFNFKFNMRCAYAYCVARETQDVYTSQKPHRDAYLLDHFQCAMRQGRGSLRVPLACRCVGAKTASAARCSRTQHGDSPAAGDARRLASFPVSSSDMFAEESINLLQRSGLQFPRHEQEGIDVNHFAELLMTSGLVLSPDTYWITFHSGYDFGYLLRLLTCMDIPEQEREFFELLR